MEALKGKKISLGFSVKKFLSIFYFDIFIWDDVCEIGWNLVKSRSFGMWLLMKMTPDSNNLREFLPCMGLIRVACEQLKVCLRTNMRDKMAFR